MMAATFLSVLSARLVKSALLMLCLMGLFTTQLAMAADQVEDLSTISTHLADGGDCSGPVASAGSEGHKGATPDPHCQSCCFHHNGQVAGPQLAVSHEVDATISQLWPGRPDDLHSAELAADLDPPRRNA